MEKIYRVEFFKHLLDSTGHQFAPCQGTVELPAPTADKALELAQAVFARERCIAAWHSLADYATVSLLGEHKRLLDQKRRNGR